MSPLPASGRPLWLLDVDGVLNAVTRWPDRSAWSDWASGSAATGAYRWPIWWSPTVTATVAELHATGVVEVRWLTTWGRHANEELRELLGLPAFEVAGEPTRSADPTAGGAAATSDAASHAEVAGAGARDPLTGRWWKFDVVRALHDAEPDRRIVWTDDDLAFQAGVRAWMHAHVACLLVAPTAQVGLTSRQLQHIRDYCQRTS